MRYLLFLFALFASKTAHSQCSEFDKLLKKGDNYLKGNKYNYQEAINAYTAAIIACPGRAEEAQQRITRMVNDINKIRESAQTALTNLEKANADVVRLILENADHDILSLRYEDALQKIKTAASLGVLEPFVVKAYLEIAFWQGEVGNLQRAKGILDSAAMLANKKIDTNQPHRKAIESFDPEVFIKLKERYYPVLVQVEGGTFDMGCDPGKACPELHKQEVSSFLIAKYETTWWQYYLFCKATGRKYVIPGWGMDGDHPAVNVNWFDTIFYLNWLNKQFGLDTFYITDNKGEGPLDDYYEIELNPAARKGYRLPTEAEWEYAAKGGNRPANTIYSGSNDLDLVGWYSVNSGSHTNAVGKKKANVLGLYDMSGNVWEWCWDKYGAYEPNSEKDYAGPKNDSNPIIRGGSWNNFAEYCLMSYRISNYPDNRINAIGFRPVFVP